MTPRKHQNQSETGSPTSGEPVFIVVGKLHRPHGVKGEMILEVLTDFPERLRRGRQVFIGPEHTPRVLGSRRPYNDDLLVSFQGYSDLEAVASMRNQLVYARADQLPPLPEGDYYHHEIVGLKVFSEAGAYLGTVNEILETGSNDVYVIQPDSGPELLLPVLESVILNVDLERGEMQVHVLPGLMPGEAEDGGE